MIWNRYFSEDVPIPSDITDSFICSDCEKKTELPF